jgi:hypothetical protein
MLNHWRNKRQERSPRFRNVEGHEHKVAGHRVVHIAVVAAVRTETAVVVGHIDLVVAEDKAIVVVRTAVVSEAARIGLIVDLDMVTGDAVIVDREMTSVLVVAAQAYYILTVLEDKVMMRRARPDSEVEDKEIEMVLEIRDVEA